MLPSGKVGEEALEGGGELREPLVDEAAWVRPSAAVMGDAPSAAAKTDAAIRAAVAALIASEDSLNAIDEKVCEGVWVGGGKWNPRSKRGLRRYLALACGC